MDQDQNTEGTPAPQSAPAENIMDTGTKSDATPILIGAVIVVAIVAIVLGYIMMRSTSDTPAPAPTPLTDTVPALGEAVNADGTQAETPDSVTVSLTTQGTSDDIDAIDADLQSTDLGSLDSSAI